ncbi:MAG: hypothetical protein K0A90_00130 [Methanosarcinaceae archaeon]|nr:hypothetical protein [Methanosarcinaceae archaeon]
MVKEIVKYIDGTTVDVEVSRLGFRRANQVAKKHIPINDLSFGKDGSVSIRGDIDVLGMIETCLETVKGIDLDKLEGADATRIYKKYFEKDVMGSLGGAGDPN